MKDLIIAGAGNPGSLKLVHDINRHVPTWNLVGIVDDDPIKWGKDFHGHPILGGLAVLQEPRFRDVHTVCYIYGGTILSRVKVVEHMVAMGVKFATLVHPSVSTAFVEIGQDCVVHEGCVLNFGVKLGDHCFLTQNVSIGHEVILEDLVFCAPSVTLPGRVRVRRAATLGAGCTIKGAIEVGEYAMVGLGSVVFKDVPARSTVLGNPARVILRDSVNSRRPL